MGLAPGAGSGFEDLGSKVWAEGFRVLRFGFKGLRVYDLVFRV